MIEEREIFGPLKLNGAKNLRYYLDINHSDTIQPVEDSTERRSINFSTRVKFDLTVILKNLHNTQSENQSNYEYYFAIDILIIVY